MIAVVGPPITREAAREAAQRELSKSIYHRYDDPWPIRLLRWIGDRIDRVTSDIARHAPGGAAGAIAIVVVILGLAVAARWRFGPVQRSSRGSARLQIEPTLRAADYRREAEAAAAVGDWSAAVVARMRAIARELEQRGAIDERPGRTADELGREAAEQLPALDQPLRAAVAVFDEVAYGRRPATSSSYAVVAAADKALRQPQPAHV